MAIEGASPIAGAAGVGLDLQAKRDIVTAINNLANTFAAGYAPSGGLYLVSALNAALSAERLVTDTPTVAWDFSVAGVAKANQAFTSTSVVATQFDKTTSTVLGNVTGLSTTVLAATPYAFRAVLFINADATGGQKIAVAGTATATSVIYRITSTDDGAPGALRITSRQVALAGSAAQAGQTAYLTTIEGEILVNAGGTLTVQFAQSASNLTSSVLVGSTFTVWKVL